MGRGSSHRPDVVVLEVPGPATVVLATDELGDFFPSDADRSPNRDDLGGIIRATPYPGQAADRLIDTAQPLGSGNKTAVVITVDPTATRGNVAGRRRGLRAG